jgi:hypothetical protein
MNQHYSKLEQQFNTIKNIQENNVSVFLVELKKYEPAKVDNVLRRLTEKVTSISSKISAFTESIEVSKQRIGISRNFNYLCLYGVLYCLGILIINGYEYDFHSSETRGCFFVFNLLSIIILSWLFWERKKWIFKKISPTYNGTLIVFIIVLIISCPIFRLLDLWEYGYFGPGYTIANIILGLLIPSGHFFYYFIRASNKSRVESNVLNTDLKGLKTDCEDFRKEMQTTFTTLIDVKILE